MTKPGPITAGINATKENLEIAIHGGAIFVVANDTMGWKQATVRLADAGVERIGIEAVSGYDRGITRHLQHAGLTVQIIQHVQVKAFAKIYLRLAKDDKSEAALIAACTYMTEMNAAPKSH